MTNKKITDESINLSIEVLELFSLGLKPSHKDLIIGLGSAVSGLRELLIARQRIVELEAREVKLPPTFWYEHDDLPRDIPVLSRRLVIKALREAGVKFAAGIGKGE